MDDVDRIVDDGGTAPPARGAVTVRYWAAARAAAGVDDDTLPGPDTVDGLLARLAETRPALRAVLPACSVLVDGLASRGAAPVPAGATVEILPPFAGG